MRLEIDGTKITLEATEPLSNDLLEQVTDLVTKLVEIDLNKRKVQMQIDIDAAKAMKNESGG
jgi:predicted RNA-binding protein